MAQWDSVPKNKFTEKVPCFTFFFINSNMQKNFKISVNVQTFKQ